MSNFKCKDFEDIGRCFEQLNSNFRSEINSLRSELKGVKEKITAIEGHVEYAQSEFQTLHNETIPSFEDKLTEETNQRLALELWGRKWNLIIRGVKSSVKDERFESPRATLHLVQSFLIETLGYKQEEIDNIQFAAAHRLKFGSERGKDIIVRMVSLIDRDEILKAARKLVPGSGFSVVPDLPPSLSKLRGELLRRRSELSVAEKKKTRLVYLTRPPFLRLITKK